MDRETNKMIQIINLKLPYVKTKFLNHNEVKPIIMKYIDNWKEGGIEHTDEMYENNIYKTDWPRSENMHIGWKQELLKANFLGALEECTREIGFNTLHMHNLWFQQYVKGNKHDWHTHAENYSGVYYLEMSEGSPGTEIYDGERVIRPKVLEGDLCIFPSTAIHRAPVFETDDRKTIISFNLELKEFSPDKIKTLNLYGQ
jgi:hypothetical protein